jgi:hypothetical protein
MKTLLDGVKPVLTVALGLKGALIGIVGVKLLGVKSTLAKSTLPKMLLLFCD